MRYSGLALLGGCLCACAGSSDEAVIRADSAGVEIVTSGEADRELSWLIEPVFSLGGAEEGPESFYMVGINNVGADDAGRIYVLDGPARRVAVFSREGQFLRTVGRGGEGPGEITGSGTLAVGPDGSVHVFDYGKGALVRFGPAGEVEPEQSFRVYPWPGPSRHIAVLEGGILASGMVAGQQDDTFRQALRLITPTDTAIIAERSYPRPGMAMYPSCGGGLNLPRIFESVVLWSARGGHVAVSTGHEYAIDVLENGRIVRRLRRRLPLRVATESDAVAELGEGFRINFGAGPCMIPPADMVSRRGFAETIPWIRQLTITPAGEVWVLRETIGSDEQGLIDVFDSSGSYAGTLPAETAFPLDFLNADRYVAAQTDELDVMRLVAYDVARR